MFTYEYRFYPKSFAVPEIDAFDDDMYWFLSSLSKSGQILDAYQNTVKFDDHYACRVVAFARDSLSECYGNKYTRQFLHDVTTRSAKPPELVFIGENYDLADACTCKAPSHYILFAQYGSHASPVLCGDCKCTVPLYRLPKPDSEEEYMQLLSWQRLYRACDLQFLQGIGERHGYKMMHDPKSPLAQDGLRQCHFYEEHMGVPFYYYLFCYYRRNRPFCPLCGEPWENSEGSSIAYDMVCSHCRLVSNDM